MSEGKQTAPAEAFVAVADLAKALGVQNINRLPGCWEHQVDKQWFIALNGHREPMTTTSGAEVAPFNCWIEFNGFPAGYLDYRGGVIAAGEIANEDTFIAAVQLAISKALGESGGEHGHCASDSIRFIYRRPSRCPMRPTRGAG